MPPVSVVSLMLHQGDALSKYQAENPTGDLTLCGLPGISFPTDNISFSILFVCGEAAFHSFSLSGSQHSLDGATR